MSHWTTLSQTRNRILSVAPLEDPDYTAGFLLQRHTERGIGEIIVTREEMLGLLHQLPTADLLAVLEVRGVLPLSPRPALGEVCACSQEAGLHVATCRCIEGQHGHQPGARRTP